LSERTTRWKMWMENPCWSEVISIVSEITQQSVSEEDRIATKELNVAVIAENRGIRIGLRRLLRRIEDQTVE
jgi:hypothetical protein